MGRGKPDIWVKNLKKQAITVDVYVLGSRRRLETKTIPKGGILPVYAEQISPDIREKETNKVLSVIPR